ncbi:hypothetical protein C3486_15420 [Streptomyces sp. Ru73]|uniref:hypothetical protein n=1 Tax=Streptomyces sp. Ru73 TaxID=2080748 RepID=UPI000CDE4645|nr:hypothetical protein [Streptomyces sp. Ru73]POX40042.1 hypothetical protein C3486_15420 [Streptomyces sp. Ru73]
MTAERGGRRGLFRWAAEHRLLACGVAVAVLAAGVAVPLAVAGGGDGPGPCHRLPASARALADDPAAATKALDPGADLARLGAAKQLLAHERVCGDGARVLGRVVTAATRAAGPGEPHTMAQARSAYAVAAALHDVDLPAGLAPGVARMVAEYVVDAGRDKMLHDDDATGPAAPPEAARLDRSGYVWLGRLLAPGDAHALFEYGGGPAGSGADIEGLVAELAKDPEAFAVLYDAERAYFAYYLEHLTREGGDPDHRATGRTYATTATTWPDNDLEDIADRVGDLMKYRAKYAEDGTVPDLAAFDARVRAHTRGTFRPASRQLRSRVPMGDIADRPASGPLRGPLTDGRYQLQTVLDRWARQRHVPERRAAAMRQLMDDAYVRALWLTV